MKLRRNYITASSSSSASFLTCMWGWCFLWDASNELGLALPPMTVLSPTIRSWCYPTTSTSVFLPFFPRHQHHYHSPAYYSSLLNTCPYHFNLYFPALFGYFVDFRCPSNSFIPNAVHLGDSTHPSYHPHFRHIQLLLLSFLHCPCLGTVHHAMLSQHDIL